MKTLRNPSRTMYVALVRFAVESAIEVWRQPIKTANGVGVRQILCPSAIAQPMLRSHAIIGPIRTGPSSGRHRTSDPTIPSFLPQDAAGGTYLWHSHFRQSCVTGTQGLSASALEYRTTFRNDQLVRRIGQREFARRQNRECSFRNYCNRAQRPVRKTSMVLGAHIEIPGALGGGATVAIGEVMAVSASGAQVVATYQIENPPRNVAHYRENRTYRALKTAWTGPAWRQH